MSYKRVIPRDLFNEAKLLKCVGHLALKIHDGFTPGDIPMAITPTINDGDPFVPDLDESLNALRLSSYVLAIGDRHLSHYTLYTTYNSKEPYPLFVFVDNAEIPVFDDNGEYTQEFTDYVTEAAQQ